MHLAWVYDGPDPLSWESWKQGAIPILIGVISILISVLTLVFAIAANNQGVGGEHDGAGGTRRVARDRGKGMSRA